MILVLSDFEPNLNDARTRRRIANVVQWCSLHLSASSPEPLHHDKLRAVFGSPGNTLTKYLRANLLIQVGSYIVGKQSMSYLLNKVGFDKLQSASQQMVATSTPDLAVLYPELKQLRFNYKLQSDRYWHPLQNIKREQKSEFWREFLPHNYDIEACAPTILFQCARRAGLPGVLLRNLESFLNDRAALRTHVSRLTGMSLNDSKQLINSLFNGAKLAANHRCSTFRRMNYDTVAMKRVQADPMVRSLVRDIRSMWARLEMVERERQQPTAEEVFTGSAKPFQKKLKTSKQKWSYYFAWERKLIEVISSELYRHGVRHFTEHDGFRTDREVNVSEIEAAVLRETGFKIKLSKENISGMPCKRADKHMVSTSFNFTDESLAPSDECHVEESV